MENASYTGETVSATEKKRQLYRRIVNSTEKNAVQEKKLLAPQNKMLAPKVVNSREKNKLQALQKNDVTFA